MASELETSTLLIIVVPTRLYNTPSGAAAEKRQERGRIDHAGLLTDEMRLPSYEAYDEKRSCSMVSSDQYELERGL